MSASVYPHTAKFFAAFKTEKWKLGYMGAYFRGKSGFPYD
jgi:hypothetical protein